MNFRKLKHVGTWEAVLNGETEAIQGMWYM